MVPNWYKSYRVPVETLVCVVEMEESMNITSKEAVTTPENISVEEKVARHIVVTAGFKVLGLVSHTENGTFKPNRKLCYAIGEIYRPLIASELAATRLEGEIAEHERLCDDCDPRWGLCDRRKELEAATKGEST